MPQSTHDLLVDTGGSESSTAQSEHGDTGLHDIGNMGHMLPNNEVNGDSEVKGQDEPAAVNGNAAAAAASRKQARQNGLKHTPPAANGTSPKCHVTKAQSFTAKCSSKTTTTRAEPHKNKDEQMTLTPTGMGAKRGPSKSLDMGQARHRTMSISSSHSGEGSMTSPRKDGPVRARIGSLDNAQHVPGGGRVQIFNEKSDYSHVTSRCGSTANIKHKPKGGDKKIETQKLEWRARSRVGSLDNASHRPGGGAKKIESQKLVWNAQSKIGSLNNASHQPGGGEKIELTSVDFRERAHSDFGLPGI